MNRRIFSLWAIGIIGALWSAIAQAEPLDISGAWVREGPPTAQVLAAYMQITNPGAQDLVITGASSPQFASVEIHRTEIVDGMARMLPQAQLVIPANGSITLEPGGLHLMLIQAREALPAGAQVEIQLQLENGANQAVTASVKPGTDAGMGHSHHH